MPETQFLPTKPPWSKPSDLSQTNEFARKSCALTTNLPQRLLRGVNATWRELLTNARGDTHHAAMPSMWCQQNKPQASTRQTQWQNAEPKQSFKAWMLWTAAVICESSQLQWEQGSTRGMKGAAARLSQRWMMDTADSHLGHSTSYCGSKGP